MQGVLRCVASALGQSCAIDFYSGKANVALQWSQGAAPPPPLHPDCPCAHTSACMTVMHSDGSAEATGRTLTPPPACASARARRWRTARSCQAPAVSVGTPAWRPASTRDLTCAHVHRPSMHLIQPSAVPQDGQLLLQRPTC